MSPEAKAILEFSLVTMSSVFFIVDPLATIPAFVVMTEHDSAVKRSRMARHAAWTCFLVLTAFAFAGSVVFKVFGITLPAFKIAGGLLLLMVGMEMLHRSPAPPLRDGATNRSVSPNLLQVGVRRSRFLPTFC
jgi:multiple antibiotic resistance protein